MRITLAVSSLVRSYGLEDIPRIIPLACQRIALRRPVPWLFMECSGIDATIFAALLMRSQSEYCEDKRKSLITFATVARLWVTITTRLIWHVSWRTQNAGS